METVLVRLTASSRFSAHSENSRRITGVEVENAPGEWTLGSRSDGHWGNSERNVEQGNFSGVPALITLVFGKL